MLCWVGAAGSERAARVVRVIALRVDIGVQNTAEEATLGECALARALKPEMSVVDHEGT